MFATPISHQKGMKHVRYCSLGIGSPEPALASVDRGSARPPPKTAWQRVTRSTRRSTTRPTSSPRRASTTAPATSTICSTASATACRFCRPPTPASPRCRSWSIPPSRSPTRCCRRPPVIRLKSTVDVVGTGAGTGTATAANHQRRATIAARLSRSNRHGHSRCDHWLDHCTGHRIGASQFARPAQHALWLPSNVAVTASYLHSR